MNKKKKKEKTTYNVQYLTIDNDNKTTHTVYDIDECDFVLIRKREFESKHTGDLFAFVRKMRSHLKEVCPNSDWEHKTSRIGNHCFWKRSKDLEYQVEMAPDWSNQERREWARAAA